MRSFAPTGHRHTAEVLQAIRLAGLETAVHLSATAVDNVRGVLATAHLFAKNGVTEARRCAQRVVSGRRYRGEHASTCHIAVGRLTR